MKITEKHKFAQENMGLVHLCANRFRGRSIEYEELFSAGCIGLMKAINAFDPQLGYKFSTYAVPVIMGEIKRLFRDGGSVKVSRSLKELSLRLSKIREQFAKEQGREPTIEELCTLADTDRERVIEALNVALPPISLTSVSDDGGSNEGGSEIDIPVDAPDDKIIMSLALRQAVSELEPRDRKLLHLRYVKNKTQTQTASELDMTQVQVSRREKKLLLLLRSKLI